MCGQDSRLDLAAHARLASRARADAGLAEGSFANVSDSTVLYRSAGVLGMSYRTPTTTPVTGRTGTVLYCTAQHTGILFWDSQWEGLCDETSCLSRDLGDCAWWLTRQLSWGVVKYSTVQSLSLYFSCPNCTTPESDLMSKGLGTYALRALHGAGSVSGLVYGTVPARNQMARRGPPARVRSTRACACVCAEELKFSAILYAILRVHVNVVGGRGLSVSVSRGAQYS